AIVAGAARPATDRRRPGIVPGRQEHVMATCPECDAEIEVDEFDVDKGDLISCTECGSNLEVTSTPPVELELSDEDEEDEDDDDREKEDEDYDEDEDVDD